MNESPLRELAHRSSVGVDVTLAWAPASDTILVFCRPWNAPEINIAVRHEDALLAYHHPFAYAALAQMSAGSDARGEDIDTSDARGAETREGARHG
jgi:hypothetical protein